MGSKGDIFMACNPKKDCFAYRKIYGNETCIALTNLYCTKDTECAFYKSVKEMKNNKNNKEKKQW